MGTQLRVMRRIISRMTASLAIEQSTSSSGTEQVASIEKGASSSGTKQDQSQGQSSRRMIKLPYEILGHLALPHPTQDRDEWNVMCCMEGFVIMYCRKLGISHLFNLCKRIDHPITWVTNFPSNPQMVYFKDNIYTAADFKIQKYNLRLNKWSLQQRFPLGCQLERLLVLQDRIVGAFKREIKTNSLDPLSYEIKTLTLEWRFLDLDYNGVYKKGWRQPFAKYFIEDGMMPAMATLNKVVLVIMKWCPESNASWLYFWNEDKLEWEFLDGKLKGGPISELVVVGGDQLEAYNSYGSLVSRCRVYWDNNGHVKSVKWAG